MTDKKRNSPRKRRVKPKTVDSAALATMISATGDGGICISTVAVAYTFAFFTKRVQASVVVLPDMPCPECRDDGVMFVNGLCVRCREQYHCARCLRSYADIDESGKMILHAEALLCATCSELEPDVNQLPLPLGAAPDRIKARWN